MINYLLVKQLLRLMEWFETNHYTTLAFECKGCLENYLDFSFIYVNDEYLEKFIKQMKFKKKVAKESIEFEESWNE